MTEELEIVNQGEDVPVEEAQAVAPDDDMQTPMYNKAQVSKIVERERQKALEKGKREALMQLEQQQSMPQEQAQQPMQQSAPMQQQGQTGLGGMQQLSPQDIERMIAEKAPQALQAHVQKLKQDHLVNTFVGKMQAAEQKYPGLEAELNQLNYQDPRMHAFIELANAMDNTGDIMKEVVDNPTKMENLLNMAVNQPYSAQKALHSLSESIKQNESATAQEKQARDPMSQLKPSTSAGIDNSTMSVADFQKMFKSQR